jgi:hypothetical protein
MRNAKLSRFDRIRFCEVWVAFFIGPQLTIVPTTEVARTGTAFVNWRRIAISLIDLIGRFSMSVNGLITSIEEGGHVCRVPNWRCEAWWDGVLVLSTPARLEL